MIRRLPTLAYKIPVIPPRSPLILTNFLCSFEKYSNIHKHYLTNKKTVNGELKISNIQIAWDVSLNRFSNEVWLSLFVFKIIKTRKCNFLFVKLIFVLRLSGKTNLYFRFDFKLDSQTEKEMRERQVSRRT